MLGEQPTSKTCLDCQAVKPIGEYYSQISSVNGEKYWQSRCKPCEGVRRDTWRAENPDRVRAYDRRKRLKRDGVEISLDEALAVETVERCEACGDEFPNSRQRHLDHCHRTGRVRGVLCHHCNLALGNVKDDPQRLTLLIKYLDSHGA